MFGIVSDPIIGPLLGNGVSAGGIVTFEGRVRDRNDGQSVRALEYEAYDALAIAEGEKILAEALIRFPVEEITCIHRIGFLALGDVAIRVEASAVHRREAFEACEWVVDEVKRRVPIWKKEHYADGPSEWLNAQGTNVVTEAAFYTRQTRLPELGEAGQDKLRPARVLVVGAGGLGCPALLYLAAAGVGHIGIVDADIVDPTNLHRQPLYRASDVGRPKARLAAERIRGLNPFIRVDVFGERFSEKNRELVREFDIVLDCTDNFATKFLLNDAAVEFGKTLVVASVHQYEGQLLMVSPDGPCLRCLWPVAPRDGCVGTCAEVGILGFVPGMLGTLQAAEAIKLLVGLPGLGGQMVLVDMLRWDLQRIKIPHDPECPTCGNNRRIIESKMEYEVNQLEEGDLLVDIREPDETDATPIAGAFLMPMSRFNLGAPEFATADRIVLICEHGMRSDRLCQAIRNTGDLRYRSFIGGRCGTL